MSNLERVGTLPQNRDDDDRREFSWRTVIFGFFRSRRRDTRRVNESEPLFTDWHHPWLFFLATGTMLLSCFDAFFTLQLIDRGMVEVNPVMEIMIGKGTLFAIEHGDASTQDTCAAGADACHVRSWLRGQRLWK